ncbi:MAG: twin-arginine translocation signal domain-containing protein [Planctomycetales bacterium]|nr:twin-arginine translocation signal domain-containing protein [Planctomycetales bacterium]
MDRRRFLQASSATVAAGSLAVLSGCRGHQYAHVLKDNQQDMVGSHTAGAETFNPLIDEAVARLLARQQSSFHQAGYQPEPVGPRRICFVGVENASAEELGDFKEQVYEQIDSQILQSQMFQPISRRFVETALRETRLRPDSLFMPENMRMFAAVLEQQGQPFDYLLFAKLTSGTTTANKDYQRDYLLTLDLVNVHTGQYDKESAKIRKAYHKSAMGKLSKFNPFQ